MKKKYIFIAIIVLILISVAIIGIVSKYNNIKVEKEILIRIPEELLGVIAEAGDNKEVVSSRYVNDNTFEIYMYSSEYSKVNKGFEKHTYILDEQKKIIKLYVAHYFNSIIAADRKSVV